MEFNWKSWQPRERATLLFVVRDGEVLLIRKKRGFGAGKINGPGGRIEPGETSREAAIRETREELGIEALSPELRGELHFQFLDGYSLHCSVFVSTEFVGQPIETVEAVPWMPSPTKKCGPMTFAGFRGSSPVKEFAGSSSSATKR